MKWTSVRIDVGTLRMLEEYRARLEKAVQRGTMDHPCSYPSQRVSLGEALWSLLNQKEKHRQRSRRQGAGRKKPKVVWQPRPATDVDNGGGI